MSHDRLHGTLSGCSTLGGQLNTPSALSATLGVKPGGTADYEKLKNKPQINGVTLLGNQSAADLHLVYVGTVEEWASDITFIPPVGAIVIYTDYATDGVNNIPNYKIGDGLAYLVDLPFVDDGVRDLLNNHISNQSVHVSAEDRASWDNKVTCDVVPIGDGNYGLVLTKD